MRGRANVGKYKLKVRFSNCSIDKDDISVMDNLITPDNIVNYIRGSGAKVTELNVQDKDNELNTQSQKSDDLEETVNYLNLELNAKKNNRLVNQHYLEQHQRKIKLHTWLKWAALQLKDLTINAQCSHIITAKLGVALNIEEKKRTINLSRLRKNTRQGADKKSGTKKPRHYDYIPAPDSVLGKSAINLCEDSFMDNFSRIEDSPYSLNHSINLSFHEDIKSPCNKLTSTPKCKRKVTFNDTPRTKKMKVALEKQETPKVKTPKSK